MVARSASTAGPTIFWQTAHWLTVTGLLLLCGGCHDGTQTLPSNQDGAADGVSFCHTQAETSNLPGVRLSFPDDPCAISQSSALAGIAIPYDVVIDNDVMGINSVPHYCGNAAGPSGLIVFEELAGGAEKYCVCEGGSCPPSPPSFVALSRGTYRSSFVWNGRNFQGPSTADASLGTPFPRGTYTLTITSVGSWNADGGFQQFSISATRQLQVF